MLILLMLWRWEMEIVHLDLFEFRLSNGNERVYAL